MELGERLTVSTVGRWFNKTAMAKNASPYQLLAHLKCRIEWPHRALQFTCWSVPGFRVPQEPQAAMSNVGASPYPAPATTEIHNNINIIAPPPRGFLHLPRRIIAASVAALGKCSNNKTGPFGSNRIASRLQLKRATLFDGKALGALSTTNRRLSNPGTSF